MENYDNLIKEINTILDTAESIENTNEKFDYLNNNCTVFEEFIDSITLILMQYQFKENSNSFKTVMTKLLALNGFFENIPHLKYYKSNLLDALNRSESKFAFRLQYEKNMSQVECALEYLQDRSEYVSVLKENKFFEGQPLNEGSARDYVSNNYEQNMYGHALIQLKENFLTLPREKVIELVQLIDNSPFWDELISKNSKNMNFFENNLLFQYCDSVIRMKSIFTPDKLKDDRIINAMWSGKIHDSKTLKCILESLSANSFATLLGEIQSEDKNGFFIELANHFENVNMSTSNISIIMKSLLEKGNLSYESATLLAKIDVPADYYDFLDSQHAQKFPWLTDANTFLALKNNEKSIEDARSPFLPAEYYIQKIQRIDSCPNINSHFVGNLLKLMHTDYYTPEENQSIKNSLENAGLWNQEEFDRCNELIALDEVKQILNNDLSGSQPLDKSRLQQCVQSMICGISQERGIDLQDKVFFGNGHSKNHGYYDTVNIAIWIDDNLLDKYINAVSIDDKAALFRTIFHEMNHAVQYDNLKNGKMDFITYNFLKEEIIEQYDPDFYDKNYLSTFVESDSRKREILETFSFFKDFNIDFAKAIFPSLNKDFHLESNKHTLQSDSKKTISIGKDTSIDVSQYVGLLIQNNPQILTQYPILGLEYNSDGSIKEGIEIDDQVLQEKFTAITRNNRGLVSISELAHCYNISNKAIINNLFSQLTSAMKSKQVAPVKPSLDENGDVSK